MTPTPQDFVSKWKRAEAREKHHAAVCAAYGWPEGLSDDEILEKLLALNLERAKIQGVG
jgi:hypothetical protein